MMAIYKGVFSMMVLLMLLPVSGHTETTAREVIAQVVDAYGGRDAVAQVQAVCARGKIVAFAFNNAEGPYSYCVAKGRKLRVDISYPRFEEHRVLNGQTAFVQTGDGALQTLTSGADYLSVVYQYEQLSLPRVLLDQADHVRYGGRELLGEEPAHVLVLEAENSLPMKIYVEAASGHIMRTSVSFQMGGTAMMLSSNFNDFRKVGNTLFPFRFVNFAGGDRIAETSILGYEVNPSLTDQTFEKP